jgi:4-aminobutyrate aminotransferase-like enzyme/Ser/Thr protein kinase RdoA (MazF antagonist)
VLEAPAPNLSLRDAELIAKDRFGIGAAARLMTSERDQNFRLGKEDGGEFLLKISNPAQDPGVSDFQCEALRHIADRDPDLPIPRVCATLEGSDSTIIEGQEGMQHIASMFTFLPGRSLEYPARTRKLRYRLGEMNARLGRALRGFFHPAAGHVLLWDIKQAGRLRERLDQIDDSKRRQFAERWLDRFESHTLPALSNLRAQVIHNDMTPDNVLVDDGDPERITGIIDFGDMVHSALVNDLAVAATHHLAGDPNPIEAVSDVLAGYHSVTPLEAEEVALLFDLIATRLASAAVITAWRRKRHPEKFYYNDGEEPFASDMLERLTGIDRESIQARFRDACGDVRTPRDAGSSPSRTPSSQAVSELIAHRERLLGPAYELFYDAPLHLVRGEGVWLTDADGRSYLDVYNNVAHVGHCHPRVTEALASQARTLNTNTRYLDRTALDYAERLTASFPGDLSVCMFVCTGSEANDLAWRLARAHTGHEGSIVTEHSYHGNTTAISAQSTEDVPAGERPAHVKTIPAPDDYRGPYRRGESALGERYAARLDEAIEALRADGLEPASFLFDSIFASAGILLPPDGYLRSAFQRVRAAGGICIADEVQAGFGRTGTHMWGFAAQNVVPDIVTLGKPMGNGHPLAAVITTPEIAGALAKRGGYFNTFGGNPVSCAVGLAVLEALEREALQDNALRVGSYMKTQLRDLAVRHTLIGDVRGSGLFLGVELVRDRKTLEPAPTEARAAMNQMRQHGVLVGLTGPHRNVLKIRPPMVFSKENADLLTETLDRVLREV